MLIWTKGKKGFWWSILKGIILRFFLNLLAWHFLLLLFFYFFNKRPGPVKYPVWTSPHSKFFLPNRRPRLLIRNLQHVKFIEFNWLCKYTSKVNQAAMILFLKIFILSCCCSFVMWISFELVDIWHFNITWVISLRLSVKLLTLDKTS